VKRLAGKPFALLGVNSDASPAVLRKVIAKEKIVWRSWFDGGGKEGPIATKWQIDAWPTLFLIDAQGVIRHIESDGGTPDEQSINKRIDALLKELAAKDKKGQ
jgi:hypothetical protein